MQNVESRPDKPSTGPLDSLPTELKLNILRESDLPTLRALLHASPSYHQVYKASRSAILTPLTIRNLESKGINILPPSQWHPLPAAPYRWSQDIYASLEVCIVQPTRAMKNVPGAEKALDAAFNEYYSQAETLPRERIRLSAEDCQTLMAVNEVMGFGRGKDGGFRGTSTKWMDSHLNFRPGQPMGYCPLMKDHWSCYVVVGEPGAGRDK